ncbi:MAG: cardiolipin synthase [Planctomycetes bacterium]|nr:cardiolipin synthase [Planctomycetota bacterium]
MLTFLVTALELTGFLLIPVVILRSREPLAAVAWILAIILMPGAGAVLYLAIGTTRIARKTHRKKLSRETLGPQFPTLAAHEVSPPSVTGQSLGDTLMVLACRTAQTRPTRGNLVEVITDVHRAYELQVAAIRQARHHIHLEYYIFQPDETGLYFRDLLIAKAREGVRVRFLYDAVGSLRLGRRFLRPMWQAGIQAECFLPVNPLRRRWVFNLRNHRKILVVDGEVGFTGGANVGNEYIGRKSQFGYWRDTNMMLRGPSVSQLQQVFAEDWFFASDEELLAPELYPAVGEPGDQVVQIVASGPDMPVEVAHELFVAAIALARQRVLIETCYFVPPESIRVALQSAAHRGVTVQIILPARSAHLTALLAAHSYYEELLASGVQIFEYAPGLLHSKMMVVDSDWSYVGSTNLDNRSLRLNFEVGAVFYGSSMTERLAQVFQADLGRSQGLDLAHWSERWIGRRLMENTCRLLSPML